MWFDKQVTQNCIAISCKPQYLAYAYLKKNTNQTSYVMTDYACIPLTNLELEYQVIFNPTALKKQLAPLLHKHKNRQQEVRISIEGPKIVEHFISSDIDVDKTYGEQFKHLVWNDMTLEDHTYVCGMSRELLFQYQLFALTNNLDITCITTSNMALLNSFQILNKKSEHNHITCLHDIHNFIASQNLASLCAHIPSHDDPLLMAELIGLCTAELTYENN